MSFLDLALARRSVRAFTPEAVSRAAVAAILEAARHAPSAGNCQPWHFYVVQDKARAVKLREGALGQSMLTDAPLLIVVCADLTRAAAKYGARGTTLYCLQDTAAAMQNILLCAADLGLGGCWIGAFNEAAVSAALELPNHLRPVAIAAIGWPEVIPDPRARREIDEIVTFLGG